MALTCTRTIPEVDGLKDNELTVGRHVLFQCSGDFDKTFKFELAQVKADEKNKYKVKVLKAEARSATEVDFDVVFYSAGEFKFPDMILTDGQSEISLGTQNLKVESVIEQPKDGKPPQPFGAIIPAPLSFPVLYILILILALVAVIGTTVWNVRKRVRYRKLMAKLKDYESSNSADLQFYKLIRKAESAGMPIKELEHAFRLYVLRRYQIPMFDLKDGSILRFFKSHYPWLKKEQIELKKLLEDISLVKDTSEDKKQLVQKMYRFVDRAEELSQKGLHA